MEQRGALRLGGAGLHTTRGTVCRTPEARCSSCPPVYKVSSERWIAEASVQIPVHQDLNGSQVEADVLAVVGFRIPFGLPW